MSEVKKKQANQYNVEPKFDLDGNPILMSAWAQRRAAGYVKPKDRPPGAELPPMITTQNREESAFVRREAQKYTDEALRMLHHIAQHGKNETARVAACNALLDRGYGRTGKSTETKPMQATRIEVSFNGTHAPMITGYTATEIEASDDGV